jgi:hypothetical protein
MRGITLGRTATRTAIALALMAIGLAIPAYAAEVLPRATTGGVKHVHGTSAQLNGVVDPNGLETSYYFQYGPTTPAYGASTKPVPIGKGTKGIKVGQTVTGLLAGYHYRIVAIAPKQSNPAETVTVFGKDKSFGGSKSSKLKFNIARSKGNEEVVVPYGGTAVLQGALTGLGFASHGLTLQATPFPYTAAFTQLAGPVLSTRTGTFIFKVTRLLQNTEFRILTTDPRPTYSPTLTVHVAPRIVLHVRPAGKGRYRMYGTISPSRLKSTVVIQQLRPQKAGSKREGPRAHTVGTAAIKRGGQTFSRFSVVLTLTGTFHYQASIKLPAKGPLVSGASNHVLVKGPKTAIGKAKHKGHHKKKK